MWDAGEVAPADLPDEALMFVLPSRYCESDVLADEAFRLFGSVQPGWARVQAVSDWANGHLGFQYGASSPSFSARDVFDRGLGVCRDFAHLAITMCRALNIPARYVFGYLPDIGVPDPGTPMDFCAWMEVYLGDGWHTFDPRNNQRRDRADGDRARPRRGRRGDGHLVRRGRAVLDDGASPEEAGLMRITELLHEDRLDALPRGDDGSLLSAAHRGVRARPGGRLRVHRADRARPPAADDRAPAAPR